MCAARQLIFPAQFCGLCYEPPGGGGEIAMRLMMIVAVFVQFVISCDTVILHLEWCFCPCV